MKITFVPPNSIVVNSGPGLTNDSLVLMWSLSATPMRSPRAGESAPVGMGTAFAVRNLPRGRKTGWGAGDIVQGEDERRGLDSGRLFPESTLPAWFRGFRLAKGPA